MTLSPTEQWLETYKEHLNDSDDLDDAGAGRGVDFDGDMQKVLRCSDATELLGDIAADMETTHLLDRATPKDRALRRLVPPSARRAPRGRVR